MPETLTIRTLLGYRFLDAATDRPVSGRLRVTAQSVGGGRTVEAYRTASGAYAFGLLPGLRAYTYPGAEAPPAPREFWVEVVDLEGRFLPVAHRVTLPRDAGSPPSESALVTFYLFSAPSRPVPSGLAVVRADLVDPTAEPPAGRSEAPAAHAVLEVEVDGATHLGLADEHGRVLVLFPYPAVSVTLSGSPPSGESPLGEQTWDATVRVRYEPDARRSRPGSDVPELASLRDQAPAAPFGSPPGPEMPVVLRFGEDLVLRSGDGPLSISPSP